MLKIGIAAVAIVLLLVWHFVKRGKVRGLGAGFFDAILLLMALASVLAYFEFGSLRYGQYMNPHDVYHYYIGAKYSPEHGYFDLYRCTLVADHEMRGLYSQRTIRNLDNHTGETTASVLQRKETYKAAFTPERWAEFKKDIAYFQSVMPLYKWQRLLGDKGYNATPVWNTVARWLCERAPTDSVWAMRFLTYIDLGCLLAMFALVWAAFGWRAMLFVIIFHGTNYFMAFVHIKGAFMRLDWVACLVMAACLLKLERYKTAGGLLAYAAMARVFPVIFGFALGAKLIWNMVAVAHDRVRKAEKPTPLNLDYWAFFLTFAGVALILVGVSAWADGGFHLWRNFLAKIAVHDKDISTTRAGFKYIFLYTAQNKALAFEQHKVVWWSIMGVVLFVVGFIARRLEDQETLPLGFIPVFFLTAPTFYYYVMLVVPFLFFVPKVERLTRMLGMLAMFAISIAAYWIGFRVPHGFQFFFICSCMLLGLCVYMGLAALIPAPAYAAPVDCERALPPTPRPRRFSKTLLRRWAPRAAGLVVVALVCGLAFFGVTRLAGGALGKRPSSGSERTLAFVGDVMLSRNVARVITARGGDYTYPFQVMAPFLQKADAAFCNLECPISGQGAAVQKNYTFNADPVAVEGLHYAGFDVVSVANNHILDSGPPAMEDTLRLLAEREIQAVGLCINDAPQEPVILDLGGLRVGYLAYCDPVPKYAYAREFLVFEKRPAKGEPAALARDIAKLKPLVDIVVVSMHWGVEYTPEPDAHTRELGRFIIDQGAHIVAGHHPHVQHEPEVYKNGLIIYSMGNFVFDQHSRPPTRLSRLYQVVVGKGAVLAGEYLPLEIAKGEWQPRPTTETFVAIPGFTGVPSASK